MATFIKVSSADAELLRRNRDQVQGNRLQKVEGDEQRRTAADIRKAQASKPEEPSTRRLGRTRPDEPAASRFEVLALGHAWYDNWVTDASSYQGNGYYDGTYSTGTYSDGSPYSAITRTITIAEITESVIKELVSSDGTVTTQLLTPSSIRSTGAPYDSRYLVLPLNTGSFLLVTMGYSFTFNVVSTQKISIAVPIGQPPYTEAQTRSIADSSPTSFQITNISTLTSGNQRFFNAYLCTKYSVNEITVPAKLQPVLELLNPEPTEDTGSYAVYPNWPSTSGSSSQSYTRYYYPFGSVPALPASQGDPRIYAELNAFAVDNDLEPLLDPGNPAYKLFFFDDEDRTNEDSGETNWLYAYLTGKAEDGTGAISAPRYDYNVSRSITEPPDFNPTYPVRRRKIDYSTLGVSAGYCRAMALALGFTAADLTP